VKSRGGALDAGAVSDRKLAPAVLLCVFFGVFGAHRFYTGKTGTALLQLFTLGGLGIWATIDLIFLIVGAFKDKEGRRLTEWT
jgi:TM2 domain-containing membrane protein YozV